MNCISERKAAAKVSTAVFIGRFQPITNKHRERIEFIALQSDIDELIIIKGSSQWNDSNHDPDSSPSRNPFTADECCEMIRIALIGRIAKPWRIIIIPDTSTKMSDPLWKEWVVSIVAALGERDVIVFTNDPREVRAFARVGFRSRSLPLADSRWRAAVVRERIAYGLETSWKQYVDPKVADYIEKIRGPERLRRLFELERRRDDGND